MQRHFFRSEIWLGASFKYIPRQAWHAYANPSEDWEYVLEIQFGNDVREDDIERL